MVTAVTGASLSFLTGHPKKQDKAPATTGTSAGTVSSDTTDTRATSPAASGTTADIGAAAPPAAIHAPTSAAASPTAEDVTGGTQAPRLGAVPETAENRVPNLPMTPHLREMIAQLKSPLPIPAGLHRFMTDFDPNFDMLTVSRPLPQAQQVKRDMIAAPATTLMAQANFDRHDVLALLGLQGGGAATLN